MEPARIADHVDVAAMRLQSASDNLEAANDALDRAIRDNAPLPYAHALRDAKHEAAQAYARAWNAMFATAAHRTPPQPIRAPTVEQVDRQRLANRLRALFAPDAPIFPHSPLSSP
jgi:hypothetical protein